jgi:hypothetical protein
VQSVSLAQAVAQPAAAVQAKPLQGVVVPITHFPFPSQVEAEV